MGGQVSPVADCGNVRVVDDLFDTHYLTTAVHSTAQTVALMDREIAKPASK